MESASFVLGLAQTGVPSGLVPIAVSMGGLLLLAVGFIVLLLFSQRRVMEAVKARSEAQERLLEAAQAGRLVLWTAESTGTLQVGASSKSVLGAEPTSVEALLDLATPEDRPKVQVWLTSIGIGEGGIRTFRMRHPKGATLETQWQVQNKANRLEGVIRDITQEAQLQAQLLQSQKLEAVGTLASGISHEFGNLLMTVEACVDGLVRDEGLDPGHQVAAHHIQDAAQRGNALIRQLLAFSRKGPREIRPENPNLLVEELRSLMSPVLGRRHPLTVEATENLPLCPLDRSQLLQSLMNLCLNARDAMPDGGAIRLCAFWLDGHLILEVRDKGPGIPQDLQERIFEPFFTTKEAGKGTGLGLAVTLRIILAHGGALSCENAPGGGGVFRISLPYPLDPSA